MKPITKIIRPKYIRLSKIQQEILQALTYSPIFLKTINVYNIVGTPYYYHSIWRSIERLRKNKLVEKVGKCYKATPLGIEHLERRRKQQ